MVSVIMAIYNEPEKWLRESIESVLTQSFSDFEYIIINDNPDRNADFLRKYQQEDSRIVIINNDRNLGLTKSLNIALLRARGKYIARMDGDDITHPKRLELQYQFLEKNNHISLVGSWVKTFGGKKNQKWRNPTTPSKLKTALFFGNRISHASVMFRKDKFLEKNLKYDLSFQKAQDYDLWYRASLKLNLSNLNKFLLYYRVHEHQISSGNKTEQDVFADKTRLNFLKHIVSDASPIEEKLHLKMCSYQKLSYSETLELLNWLNKLKKRNTSENLFDIKYFEKLIKRRALFYSFTNTSLSLNMRMKLILA